MWFIDWQDDIRIIRSKQIVMLKGSFKLPQIQLNNNEIQTRKTR